MSRRLSPRRAHSAAARSPKPLAGLTFCLVGPGRVGASLTRWAAERGAELVAVGGPDGPRGADDSQGGHEKTRELAGRFDAAAVYWERIRSRDADLLLLAVPDPVLEEAARRLSRRAQAPVVLHTSGRHGAEALAPLRGKGSAVGTLHPLRAFPRASDDLADAAGTVFGIEGDAAATELARQLALAWYAIPLDVPSEARAVYHLAATLAAGGVVTLLAAAAELAARAGVPPQALDGYLALARGALDQAAVASAPTKASAPRPGGEDRPDGAERRLALAAAITGPVARGDRETVSLELDALGRVAPDLEPLVVELALESLRRRSALPLSESVREAADTLHEFLEGRRRLC